MPNRIPPSDPVAASTVGDTLELLRATEQATRSQRELNAEFDISKQLGRQFGQALTTAFVGIAVQGKNLGDVLSGLAQNLSKLALNAAFKPLESILGNALQGLVTGGFSSGGATLPAGTPGLFASAGNVAAPAAFPLTQGALLSGLQKTPTGASAAGHAGSGGAAGSVAVTFNVTSPDVESFRRSETQLAAMLARSVGSGQRNL